jgi:hypothetical protein
MRRTRKRVTKRGGKSIRDMAVSAKNTAKYISRDLMGIENRGRLDRVIEKGKKLGKYIGQNLDSAASNVAHRDDIFSQGLTAVGSTLKNTVGKTVGKLGNAIEFGLKTDFTRQGIAAFKSFVNAGDVDRILIKNQQFLSLIEPQQVKSMYKKEHDYEVEIYEIKDTMFFNGTYIYRKEYLESYLRDKKKKYDKIVGDDDDDDFDRGDPVNDSNIQTTKASALKLLRSQSENVINPNQTDGLTPKVPILRSESDPVVSTSSSEESGDGSEKPGENPNPEAEKKAADAKVEAFNKEEDMDMGDRSFLECGSMPKWSEASSLAILNDYRILDPDHELLEKNVYETDSIAYISFHRDFATLYRLLLNYKHQYNRSLWNVSEQITMRHIKHTLRVNYAFIKRNYSIKQDFKETSNEFLQFLRLFGASFTKMFTSGEINKTDAKRDEEKNKDIKKLGTTEEPEDEKAKQGTDGAEGAEGEGGSDGEPVGEEGKQTGGFSVSSLISEGTKTKWMERRIGTKLYKYYNYNFEKYFTTVTSTKAIKNIGRTITGIGGSEYIKPHYMDVEVAFAVLIAISILNEYGLYGLAKDKYKKILELDLTTYEIKYKKEVTDKGTTYKDTCKGNYTVQELDGNVKKDLERQRNNWKRFFSTGTDYEDANFVDHRCAKTDSYYLLEDDANKELYELLNRKKHSNGQVNVLEWIQEFCKLYKEKKSVEELKIKDLKEQEKQLKEQEKKKQKGGQDNEEKQEGGEDVQEEEEQAGGGDDIGDGTLYRFLNVVFDKCFRFMNQRFVWDLEKQYLSDKDKKQNNGKTVERNICDFMNYVNKTKYDATNVFSNTLLFNIVGTFTPGGVAMTPHLNTSTRTFALYIGSLLNMLTKEEIIDLRNLFKDVYVCNLMDNPLNLAEVKDMYEKEGKRDVYIPLMGSSAVVEIRKFEELGSKCKIHFVAQDMKRSSENPDAKAITRGENGEGDYKTGESKEGVTEIKNPLTDESNDEKTEAKTPPTGESEAKSDENSKLPVPPPPADSKQANEPIEAKSADETTNQLPVPPADSKQAIETDVKPPQPPEEANPTEDKPVDESDIKLTLQEEEGKNKPSDTSDAKTPPESKKPTIDKEKCIKRKTYVLNDKNKKFRIAYKIKKTYASIKFNEDGSIKDEATGKIWSQADISKGLPLGINGIYFGTLIGINRKNISALGKVAETMNRTAIEKAKANIANAVKYTGNKTLETANDAFDKTVETVKYTGDKIQETEKYIQNKIKDAPNAVINKLKDAHNAADNRMKQFSESAQNVENNAHQAIEKFGKFVEAPITTFRRLTKKSGGGRKNKKTRRGGGIVSMASKIKDRAKEGATNLLDSAYKRTLEEHDNIVFKVKVFGMLVATKDTEITYMMEKIGTKDEVAGTGTDPKKKTWFEIYEIDPPRSQILPSAVAPGSPNTKETSKPEGTQSTVVPPSEVTPSNEASYKPENKAPLSFLDTAKNLYSKLSQNETRSPESSSGIDSVDVPKKSNLSSKEEEEATRKKYNLLETMSVQSQKSESNAESFGSICTIS